MGVPKFYRWISERYPCLSEIVKENQIPEFDNLYLDMNGIIHTCSHPNDDDPHFRITEEQIFRDIFRYIEVLFRIIRPRKVFFMAVDGVAPRAKMNQQRGRRFMSARTAQELIEQAKKKGEKLPTDERFDSNCITPGTVFMAKLHEQLKYFVNMKITTDDMWQGIRIYLSGHDVPGEGEHKIMDFIRHERSLSNYNPNTRHCLYGLDADLIMLGMCSHEPYFSLLREEIKFVRPSKKSSHRTANAEQTTFHLLHLSLLRDYLELEFSCVKEELPFPFDLEAVIDDWVLMGFLVGNDFIPHLPNLHIHTNALPTLYSTYKTVLPQLGGYINERGYLNLIRFEQFLITLTKVDRDHFADEYEDLKWMQSRISEAHFPSRDIRENVTRVLYQPKPLVPYTDSESENLFTSPEGSNGQKTTSNKSKTKESDDTGDISHMSQELQDLILRSNLKDSETSGEEDVDDETGITLNTGGRGIVNYEMCGDDDEDSESWTPDMEKQFTAFKSDYYKNKMNFDHVSSEVLHDQAVQYVRAIQWNLHYYYNGICSWSWFYPHHYAPYLSDVKGFANIDLTFDLGEPFRPFEQLLAVLPSASKNLLPLAYQPLMTDSESPVIDFYPTNFLTDLNGKKNDWEAVILIPFIAEGRLLKAMSTRSMLLTDEEKARNKPGKHLLFTTSAQDHGFYRSSLMGIFPDLEHNKAICTELEPDIFRLDRPQIRKGILPGVHLDYYVVGFSTLKHIPHTGVLVNMGVKVFEQNSKNESILIKLLDNPIINLPLPELAEQLLDKEVYVNWPHLSAASVNAISTEEHKYTKENGTIVCIPLTKKEAKAWKEHAEEIRSKYELHRAVNVGDVSVLLYVNRLIGKKYVCSQRGEVTLEKQWGELTFPYAVQTVVENEKVYDVVACRNFGSVDDLFPIDTRVFLIANPYYGSSGVIQQPYDKEKGRCKVMIKMQLEPDFSRLIARQGQIGLYWYPGWQVAQKLGISSHFLSRITGTVFVFDNAGNESDPNAKRYNIGLDLKFSKKNEEVPDYTKRDTDGVWLYSSKVLNIVSEYMNKFPEICDHFHNNDGHRDVYNAEDFWPSEDSKERLKELVDWLKSLPCYGAQHQTTGTETIDERVIRAIESAVEKTKALRPDKNKLLGVRPNCLFRSCMSDGSTAPDSRADFRLFDRVVCAREGFTVPIGLRGTVVGIHPGRYEGDLKLSVIFDEEFIGGVNIRNSKNNGYQISASALINLSFGVRLDEEKTKKEGVIVSERQDQASWQNPQFWQQMPIWQPPPHSQSWHQQHHDVRHQSQQPHFVRQQHHQHFGQHQTQISHAPIQLPTQVLQRWQPQVSQKQAHSQAVLQRQQSATKPDRYWMTGGSAKAVKDNQHARGYQQVSTRPEKEGQMNVLANNVQSVFQISQHRESSIERIQRQASYPSALQGGKSIMNEIFPSCANGSTMVAANASPGVSVIKENRQEAELERKTKDLRALLRVGNVKGTRQEAKQADVKSKASPHQTGNYSGQSQQKALLKQQQHEYFEAMTKTPQSGRRVPMTARQPEPPSFIPEMPTSTPIQPKPPKEYQASNDFYMSPSNVIFVHKNN